MGSFTDIVASIPRKPKFKKKKAKRLAQEQIEQFNQQLQEILGERRSFLSPLLGQTSRFLEGGGEGFAPEELAALRGQAIEGNAIQFNDLERQLKVALARRGAGGGQLPVGGDFARNLAALRVGRVINRSQGLRDIDIQNALSRRQNFFNAANIRLGAGSIFNPAPFVSGASSALGSRTQIALKPSLGAQLGGAAIGAAGGIFAGAFGGGGGGGGG